MKSPLIWTGKKAWLVPYVKPLWDLYKNTYTFVEPFGGSLSMAFGLEAKRVMASDICPGWFEFFEFTILDDMDWAIDKLGLKNTKESYNKVREAFNQSIEDEHPYIDRHGIMFYYLNRMCFGGNMRVNKKGQINTPYGYRKEEFSLEPLKDPLLKELVEKWSFGKEWKKDTLSWSPASSFTFADPPYDESTDAYGVEQSAKEKQIEWANTLSEQLGPIIACNAPTVFIEDLYTKLGFTIFEGSRTGTGFHSDKRKGEFIMLKNFTEEQMALFKLPRRVSK